MASREIRSKNIRIIIRTDVIDREFFSSGGGVAELTKSAANTVLKNAERGIGLDYTGSFNNNNGRKRKLSDSGKVVRAAVGGPNFEVVFTHPAAVVHHTGAKPHIFVPKVRLTEKKGLVSNIWRHEGRGGNATPYPWSALKPFRHPGHTANPYLTDAARDAGLRVSQRPTAGRPGIGRIPRGFV